MRFTKTLAGSFSTGRVVAAALLAVSCAAPARQAAAQPLRHEVGAYAVEVLVGGVPAPTFHHAGETYVMGQRGERYTLRVWNRSGRRIEAVVSVDGRDVVDGKPADPRKRGYLVPAWGHVDIDGWRLSQRQAAAFRFTSVPDSYAARTGSARNVGVIGVAVFPERVYAPPPRPQPISPYPHHDRYRDRSYDDGWGGYGPRAEAPSSAPAEAEAKRKSGPAPAPSRSAGAPSAAESSAGDGAIAGRGAPVPQHRPGLGTSFGEAVTSHIREVEFVRASHAPSAVLGVRYNDRNGLIAMGVDVDAYYYGYGDDTVLRRTANPFPTSHRPYAAPPPGWR